MTGLALGFQPALYHHLCGNARVVGAGLPQGIAAPHAVVARQRVHDGVLKRVAHVQGARHVGRRDHDAVGLVVPGRSKVAGLFPMPVDALLNGRRVVSLVHGLVGLIL